ncbi:MAG: NADH:flavin oxidoreductase [Deltaproteobacteria bacterium]|nr:NADH:flavin oxidoreductase [Deltaproteobacteria bacterium]
MSQKKMAAQKSEFYPELFKPIMIGKVEIKNRVVMAPTNTAAVEPGGYISDRMIYFYAARAKGGTGLIITGAAVIEPSIIGEPFLMPFLYNPSHVPGWSELAETIHAWDAKAFVQIDSGGPGRLGAIMGNPNALAPSPVPINMDPERVVQKKASILWQKRGLDLAAHYHIGRDFPVPKEIPIEHIRRLEDQIVHTIEMARHCGFDGAELHFAHGIMGSNFLSPRTNTRTDEYGGSLENRARYLRNILQKARQRVGPDFALGFRISAAEHMPGGLAAEDTAEICKHVESSTDFIDVSTGMHHESHAYMEPEEDGTIIDEASIIRQKVSVPVITVSVHNPATGNDAIKQGKTDMIALSRGLIADPEWANKAREGKKYVRCVKCLLGCSGRVDCGLPIRCEVNPNVMLEYQMPEYYRTKAPNKRTYHVE